MIVQCERCKTEKECRFYGRPSDVETDKAQNGEWLCGECVPLRCRELDEAIVRMICDIDQRDLDEAIAHMILALDQRNTEDSDDENEGVDL